MVQEEQEGLQRKGQEGPEENGPAEEVDDPSLPEDPAEVEEEYTPEDAEEGEAVEELEAEELVEEELIQRRGCLWGCLTPVAVILAVVLVLIVIGYAKRNVLRSVLITRIVTNTRDRVLDELPEEDAERVKAEFEKVKAALKEGRIDEEALTVAIEEFHDSMRKRPSPEQKVQEINKLIEDMDAAIMVSEE